MVKLSLFISVLFLFFGSIYAQNNPANSVLNQTLGSVQTPPATQPPTPPAAAPTAPRPTGSVDPNLTLGGQAVGNGKYEEYQSICRLNEYDLVVDYPDSLKVKRITFLKDKIVAAGSKSINIELRLIKEYIDQHEDEEAAALIASLKKRKLSTFDNEFLNALSAVLTQNYSSARTILNKLLVDNKSNVEALLLLAEVYGAEENYYEASTIYEDLNKLTKNAYLVQHCQTLVLNSLNADGEKLCMKAAEKFPENPFPSIFIGISYRERDDLKKAILSFKKSVAIKPTEMGLTCLAEALFMKENFKESIDQFKKSMELNPYSERAILGRAWAELKQKNYTESLQAFKNACKINGKNEIEIRKAFKALSSEKISEAKMFIQLAESCGGSG